VYIFFLSLRFSAKDRLFHAHGHTCEDIYRLRYGKFERVPDAVIWPGKHEHVEAIVKAATAHNVVVIPYGGGTSVTAAVEPPEHETRMIVSIDMHEMNRIKWIDYESMMACIETGIIGKDLDAKLAKLGLCVGHEPDSSEFSSLGGWIATRASGMKKNTYGNIEDILINAKMVTPSGKLTFLMKPNTSV
jgi:alkyldihydroxyacetonephosphate synthase